MLTFICHPSEPPQAYKNHRLVSFLYICLSHPLIGRRWSQPHLNNWSCFCRPWYTYAKHSDAISLCLQVHNLCWHDIVQNINDSLPCMSIFISAAATEIIFSLNNLDLYGLTFAQPILHKFPGLKGVAIRGLKLFDCYQSMRKFKEARVTNGTYGCRWLWVVLDDNCLSAVLLEHISPWELYSNTTNQLECTSNHTLASKVGRIVSQHPLGLRKFRCGKAGWWCIARCCGLDLLFLEPGRNLRTCIFITHSWKPSAWPSENKIYTHISS